MDQNALDKTEKWKTLEHNGVFFPPEYVPHGIKMKYKGSLLLRFVGIDVPLMIDLL